MLRRSSCRYSYIKCPAPFSHTAGRSPRQTPMQSSRTASSFPRRAQHSRPTGKRHCVCIFSALSEAFPRKADIPLFRPPFSRSPKGKDATPQRNGGAAFDSTSRARKRPGGTTRIQFSNPRLLSQGSFYRAFFPRGTHRYICFRCSRLPRSSIFRRNCDICF